MMMAAEYLLDMKAVQGHWYLLMKQEVRRINCLRKFGYTTASEESLRNFLYMVKESQPSKLDQLKGVLDCYTVTGSGNAGKFVDFLQPISS